MRDKPREEGMGEVSVEVIWVTAFLLPPDGQRQWVGVFIRCWVAVREIEVLLEVVVYVYS